MSPSHLTWRLIYENHRANNHKRIHLQVIFRPIHPTYHIGKDQSGIHFRIYGNTGSGFFSKEWLSLKDIQEAISKSNKPFTSTALHPLFHGKSINTPAFMLAVLLHEGLIKREKRCYVKADPSAFMADAKPTTKAKRKVTIKTTKAAP